MTPHSIAARPPEQANGEHDFLVRPHHPDRLRRPECRPERVRADLIAQGLTWNIFRTLELLPPAFWLRRFQARLQHAATLGPAPVTVSVSLWRTLLPSPGQVVHADSPSVLADVVIETEHVVWALATTFGADIVWPGTDAHRPDPIARLIDAGAWHAGRREFYCGLIVRHPDDAPLGRTLVARYAGAGAAVTRLPGSTAAGPLLRGIGVARWSDLVEILSDCAGSGVLSTFDRSVARHALDCIGAAPASDPGLPRR